MYYEPGNIHHQLPSDPFKSCVVPRPIGWISTTSRDGIDNLAPYSQFQNITFDPPIVMFSANQDSFGQRKHTTDNVESTGEFVWNMATYDLREAVSQSSAEFAAGIDEFKETGLTKAPSRLVKPPRVLESPIQFECKYLQTVRLPGNGVMGTVDVIFGQVVAIHIADWALTDEGRIDILKIRPLARLGYHDYTSVESVFTLQSAMSERGSAGMEGSADKVNAAHSHSGTRPSGCRNPDG